MLSLLGYADIELSAHIAHVYLLSAALLLLYFIQGKPCPHDHETFGLAERPLDGVPRAYYFMRALFISSSGLLLAFGHLVSALAKS